MPTGTVTAQALDAFDRSGKVFGVDLTDLASLGQLVAAAASVGSLIVVAWQVHALAIQTREAAKQSRAAAEATRAAVYTSTAGFMIDVDKFLVDRPEVRATLYGPVGTGPDEPAQRTAAAAEMMIDIFDAVLMNSQHLGEDVSAGWCGYIGHIMHRSPVLRDFWYAHRDWYGEETRRLIDRVCATPVPAPAPISSPGPAASGNGRRVSAA
jgi:hypothetical protein